MASGQIMTLIEMPSPTTSFAPLSVRTGGSSPAENMPCWLFDQSAIEYKDFWVYLSNYGGGGLTLTIPWAAVSATTGVVRWSAALRAIPDDTEDVDVAQTYDFNDTDATTATASGELAYDTVTFTNGADMDSIANNQVGILRIRRNASHANDTLVGDAQMTMPILRET